MMHVYWMETRTELLPGLGVQQVGASRFRSVMSRATFDAPMTRPSSSRIGETVREMSIRRPSLATRTVSKCSTRSPRRKLLQDRALLVVPLRRDDEGDRLADGLLGACSRRAARPRRSTSG